MKTRSPLLNILVFVLFFLAQDANAQDAETYFNKGNTYLSQDKYDLAISEYTSALKINQEFAPAYCNRGFVYFNHSKYELAIDDYNSAPKN